MAYSNYADGGTGCPMTGGRSNCSECTNSGYNNYNDGYGSCGEGYNNYNNSYFYSDYWNYRHNLPGSYTTNIADVSGKLSPLTTVQQIRAELQKLTVEKQRFASPVPSSEKLFYSANDVKNDASFTYNKDTNYGSGQPVSINQLKELNNITRNLWQQIMSTAYPPFPDGTNPDTDPHPPVNAVQYNTIKSDIQSMATQVGATGNYANCTDRNTSGYANYTDHF